VGKYLHPAMVFIRGTMLNFSLLIPYLILIVLALSVLFNLKTFLPVNLNNRIFFDLTEFRQTLRESNQLYEKSLAEFKAAALRETADLGIADETGRVGIAKGLNASDPVFEEKRNKIKHARDSLKGEWYTIFILPGSFFGVLLCFAIVLRSSYNKPYPSRQRFRDILATLLFISVALLAVQLYGILIAYWEVWDISGWIASTSLLSLAVPKLLRGAPSADTDKKGLVEPIKLATAFVLLALVPLVLLFLIGAAVSYVSSDEIRILFWALVVLVVGLFAFWLVNRYLINLNEISLHNFYRDRLSRAYLIQYDSQQGPSKISQVDDLRLSKIKPRRGPYHILNTTLNLTKKMPESNGDGIFRNGESFVFTRNWCGSKQTGYCRTETYEKADDHIDLGTAMAISGAAANVGMAQKNIFVLRKLMGLLNVRLGYWALRPETAVGEAKKKGFHGFPGSREAVREIFGRYSLQDRYINLSDGGHFDNIGVYELLRRRCKYIIVGDAEADPTMKFEALSYIMRLARIDFGIEIKIDTSDIKLNATAGLSRNHCAVGKIVYPEGDYGYLLYCKASLTGDEPEHLQEYRIRHPKFPHQTTADQWFDENQFEAYRELGYHTGSEVLRPLGQFDSLETEDLFERLKEHWYPQSEAVVKNFTQHTLELNRLFEAIKEDDRLKFMDEQIYPEWNELLQGADLAPTQARLWLPQDTDQIRQGFYLCNLMIQLMENVYLDLNLEHESSHPDNRGWMNLFRHWAWSSMFRVTYAICASTYGARFQIFCENNLNLGIGSIHIDTYENEKPEDLFAIVNPLERHVLQSYCPNGDFQFQKMHLFSLLVSNAIDPDDQIKIKFGLALTDQNDSIIYYRVQDHLRKMGLGNKALKELTRKPHEICTYSTALLIEGQERLADINPALAQEMNFIRFEQMCERSGLARADNGDESPPREAGRISAVGDQNSAAKKDSELSVH